LGFQIKSIIAERIVLNQSYNLESFSTNTLSLPAFEN